MAYTKLGRIRPVHRGAWSASAAYAALDMVRSGGISYMANKDVPAGTPLTDGGYWAVVLDVSEVVDAAEGAIEIIRNVADTKANPLKASATGNPVQIHPDGGSLLKPVTVMEPIQPGSGDPSPSNIRPITGRTGGSLVRCGKNLVTATRNGETIGGSVVVTKNDDGYYTLNGTATANGVIVTSLMTLPAGTYTLSHTIAGGNTDNTGNAVAQLVASDTNTILAFTRANEPYVTCTLTETTNVWIRIYAASGKTYNSWKVGVQLEPCPTATAYEPYQGDTFTLDFGRTVYGGTLDWNKGVLMMPDSKVRTFDGTENWVQTSSTYANTFYLDYYNSGGSAGSPSLLDAVCSHYKTSASSTLASSDMAYYPLSYGAIYRHAFTDSRFATVSEWKAYLAEQYAAGTPVQAVEKLAEPTTIQLTPVQIPALAGANTLYTDGDGMTVDYNRSIADAYEELKNAIIAMGGYV